MIRLLQDLLREQKGFQEIKPPFTETQFKEAESLITQFFKQEHAEGYTSDEWREIKQRVGEPAKGVYISAQTLKRLFNDKGDKTDRIFPRTLQRLLAYCGVPMAEWDSFGEGLQEGNTVWRKGWYAFSINQDDGLLYRISIVMRSSTGKDERQLTEGWGDSYLGQAEYKSMHQNIYAGKVYWHNQYIYGEFNTRDKKTYLMAYADESYFLDENKEGKMLNGVAMSQRVHTGEGAFSFPVVLVPIDRPTNLGGGPVCVYPLPIPQQGTATDDPQPAAEEETEKMKEEELQLIYEHLQLQPSLKAPRFVPFDFEGIRKAIKARTIQARMQLLPSPSFPKLKKVLQLLEVNTRAEGTAGAASETDAGTPPNLCWYSVTSLEPEGDFLRIYRWGFTLDEGAWTVGAKRFRTDEHATFEGYADYFEGNLYLNLRDQQRSRQKHLVAKVPDLEDLPKGKRVYHGISSTIHHGVPKAIKEMLFQADRDEVDNKTKNGRISVKDLLEIGEAGKGMKIDKEDVFQLEDQAQLFYTKSTDGHKETNASRRFKAVEYLFKDVEDDKLFYFIFIKGRKAQEEGGFFAFFMEVNRYGKVTIEGFEIEAARGNKLQPQKRLSLKGHIEKEEWPNGQDEQAEITSKFNLAIRCRSTTNSKYFPEFILKPVQILEVDTFQGLVSDRDAKGNLVTDKVLIVPKRAPLSLLAEFGDIPFPFALEEVALKEMFGEENSPKWMEELSTYFHNSFLR